MSIKLSKISYFSLSFKLNEKKKVWLKKIGLERVGCKKIFAGAGRQEAGQKRGKEKIEGGEGGDLQRNYVVLCIYCYFKKVANLSLKKAFPRIQSAIIINRMYEFQQQNSLSITFGDILQR